jgi:hypothetical protein
VQEKVVIDRQSSKTEGGSKVPPANQEQEDCCSAVVAHTDLRTGRGTTHEEDWHQFLPRPREHTTPFSLKT